MKSRKSEAVVDLEKGTSQVGAVHVLPARVGLACLRAAVLFKQVEDYMD